MEVGLPFEIVGSWTLILMQNTSIEGFFLQGYSKCLSGF